MKNNFLKPRNYKAKLIESEFKKISLLPGGNFTERRKEALKKIKRKEKDPNRIIAPIDFNPH